MGRESHFGSGQQQTCTHGVWPKSTGIIASLLGLCTKRDQYKTVVIVVVHTVHIVLFLCLNIS